MTYETIDLTVRDSVAHLRLNRPDAANSITVELARDLMHAALQCDEDPAVRAVVLTGAGRMFCGGGDLKTFATKGDDLPHYLKEVTTYLHAAISHFVRMDAPVVAAVNGTAAGAAVGLVAMADLAVCGRSSQFNLAYTNVGLTPDAGTSFLLPRIVGAKRAMELLLLNRALSAAEALSWGLVNEVVDDEQLPARALELAEHLARGARGAYGATKRLIAQSLGAFESQMVLESETIAAHAVSAEGMEGIGAFLEKRRPQFPEAPPPLKPQRG